MLPNFLLNFIIKIRLKRLLDNIKSDVKNISYTGKSNILSELCEKYGSDKGFINIDIDELDIDEYDVLFDECNSSITKFNFNQKRTCERCKKEHTFDISDKKDVIDYMSEENLMNIYQLTSDLIYYSHYTKADIDNMYPFERTIFVGLLNKTKENLAN